MSRSNDGMNGVVLDMKFLVGKGSGIILIYRCYIWTRPIYDFGYSALILGSSRLLLIVSCCGKISHPQPLIPFPTTLPLALQPSSC